MAQRLKIADGLKTRAAFEPATFDEKNGTVEVIWTTGARGRRSSWFDGPYFEELEVSDRAIDLSRMNNGAAVLNAHGTWDVNDVIGVVERAWVDGKVGRALIRFSDREEVKPIKRDVQSGVLRHLSVGYEVQKYEKVEETDGVPVYRATRWTPAEISLVPVAFDDGAVVRSRPEPKFYEVEVDSTHEEKRAMAEQTPAAPVEHKPAATPAPAPVVDTESATRAAEEATRAERTRATTIRSLVKGQKLGDELADDLITRGVQLDGPGGARDVVLTKLAERDAKVVTDNHVRIEQGDDARDKFIRGASAWLFEKGGMGATLKAAKERGVKALASLELDGGEFRGMSLKDLARESLDRAGVKTRGMSQMDMVGLAFTSRGGMQTTSDFAVLFENVMGKILLGAYAITPDTWSLICKTDTVPDFRPSPRYRSGSLTALDSLNEHGEFKNKVIPDGLKTAISVGTKGNIIALTRQAIINDDMSALADLPQKLGRASKMSIEIDFYTLLALNSGLGPTQSDAQPFFHANRANVNAARRRSRWPASTPTAW
jgi:hypothetical protein